jgi:single-stranded-DNA-specific exonuclease
LRELGGKVIYHIPVRATESHGISLPVLQKYLLQGVDLLVTCDTGISAHEAIEYAQNKGIPVLITDHHDLPVELPHAEAIVNPKRLPREHPLGTLPGVGVAYKVIEELYQLRGEEEKCQQYLDLVALGIVADIALLRGDTRYLLQRGLDTLRHTKRSGLQAIMERAELNPLNISEEHISFVIAPRMNALGRLEDANRIVELLTTSDISQARILALELEGLNAQRKLISDQVFQAAQAQLANDPSLLEYSVLVLSYPSWPSGVIGVVAARLVEQYHRPVILLSTPPGQDARGSARSIEGINITEAIAANQDLLLSFGGHPMAAGLAIVPEKIPEFRKTLSRTIQSMGIDTQKESYLQIDGDLPLSKLSLQLVEDLERLAPFGAGNPPIVLTTRNLKLTGYVAIGRASEHLQLTIEDDLGYTQRSIWWQGAGFPLPETPFDLAYTVRASTYRGQRDVQVEWIDYRLIESQLISIKSARPAIEVIDYRQEVFPLPVLTRLQEQEKLLVWGEAEAKSKFSCLDRFSLPPANTLAIWTIPPGLPEIQSALEKVKPTRVYLFGINPGMDEPEMFLKRLAGLLKYRINVSHGYANLSTLATATAQRISTIRAGLEWLEAHGHIRLLKLEDDEICVEAATKTGNENTKPSTTLLKTALGETVAFRSYYLHADKDRLISYE